AKTQSAAMTIQSALTVSPRLQARIVTAAVPIPATTLQPAMRRIRFRTGGREGSRFMGRERRKDEEGPRRRKRGDIVYPDRVAARRTGKKTARALQPGRSEDESLTPLPTAA